MTVKREKEQSFDVSLDKMVGAIDSLLNVHPYYKSEKNGERDYLTYYKKSKLHSSTEMKLRLSEIDGGVKVKISTKSGAFVFGDIGNLYNKMIDATFDSIESKIT